jgi:hypothetical protein
MHVLDHPVLADEKHRQLARQEWGFIACFPLDVSMVLSSALDVAADSERMSCGGFSLSKNILFESLEFITNRFGVLSISPMGTVQMPSSWAQPTVGHHPRCEP